ncbi:MAG: hypothetical protein H0U82_06210 [Actinobacteria bacterium]|nr:hypothetical protein [Actinomycetota bacterium]
MRGKLPWLVGVVLAIGVGIAVAGALWLGDDDNAAAVEENLPSASSPVGTSVPAPATPAAQAAAVARLERFWTVERVVAALDHATPQLEGETRSEAPSTPSGSVPGGQRDATAEPTEPRAAPTVPALGSVIQRSCSQPPVARAIQGYPYTRFCYRGRLNVAPARTSGALIYWDDSDADSVVDSGEVWNCTATVTAAENRSVLMTAGHCVVKSANQTRNGKPRWHKSMAFVPSYVVQSFYRAPDSNDDALTQSVRKSMWFAQPIPGTDYSTSWSPSPWIDKRYWSHDFAAVVVAPRNRGGSIQTIQDVLGAQGWDMTGTVRPGKLRLLGFPVAKPFDGRVLFECRGSSHLVRGENDPAPELGVGCDMTGGSSGGPWLAASNSRGLGTVVSVNSNAVDGVPIMYGPRLSGLHLDAMRKAQNTDVGLP